MHSGKENSSSIKGPLELSRKCIHYDNVSEKIFFLQRTQCVGQIVSIIAACSEVLVDENSAVQ